MASQPIEPTGNPLDYRCPACGLFPGQRCITSRGKAHRQRLAVANGSRQMVPDDRPNPNKWMNDLIG